MNVLNSSSVSDPPTQNALRACKTCAIAKVRCMPQPDIDGAKCKRCHRLEKECISRAEVVKKTRKRRQAKTTRTAQLEQKLDGIVTLLTTRQQNFSIPPALDLPVERLPDVRPVTPFQPPRQHVPQSSPGESTQTGTIHQATEHDSPFDATRYSEDPNDLLEIFRTDMTPHFPFVVIPPSTTAAQLHRQKPFLYSAIMMSVAFRNVSKQMAMATEIMTDLSVRLLQNGEKSMDLLQGLLVYSAWYQYHFHTNSQLINLVQLTCALLFDLALNQPPASTDVYEFFRDESPEKLARRRARTSDEERAYAGCFALKSMLSVSISKRMDALQWTPYLDECCRALEKYGEYQSDIYLVYLVRQQHIIEKIERSFSLERQERLDSSRRPTAPVGMYFQSLGAELRNLKDSLPLNLQQNPSFLLHYYNTEIHLFESGLYKPPAPLNYENYTFQRLDALYACLLATKSIFDTILSCPLELYFQLPIVTYASMAHAQVIFFKLSLVEVDGWDLSYVRQTVDFPTVLDQIASRLEEAKKMIIIDPLAAVHNDVFSRYATKLKRIKMWWDAKIAPDSEDVQLLQNVGVTEAVDDLLGGQHNCFDENFWEQIMRDWETAQ